MDLTRRNLLNALARTGTAKLLAGRAWGQGEERPTALVGIPLEPFVDRLPVPPRLKPVRSNADSHHYSVTLSEIRQKVHRDLPPTVLWGFEGATPGPTIVATRGQTVTVEWRNQLPKTHRLAIDYTLDGAGHDVPEVRSTIHLHGGHVPASSDGYPMDWIVPGQVQHTTYPNRQNAATLWYHDHAMGITRLNAMMGLAGFYILEDPEEARLQLPAGPFDIPMALQDRILDARGQLVYPVTAQQEAPWAPEFFGTQVLVNGKVWPYLDVEPRRYRLRFLNASNARIFRLSLVPGQPFTQIASDGGLLAEPVEVDNLLIAPSERVDAIVDFTGRAGHRIMVVNDAPAPYPSGGAVVPRLVLEFRVGQTLSTTTDATKIPATLADVPRLKEVSATRTRQLKLVEVMANHEGPHRILLDGKRFMDPVSEDPVNGSVEIWEIVNTTIDTHPIHLHAVHFQLLDRRPFDTRQYQRTSVVALTGRALPPPPQERGWKDTIVCPSGYITRIITPFSGEPGTYVWHCHMLEHEDNEMMRPYLLRGA